MDDQITVSNQKLRLSGVSVSVCVFILFGSSDTSDVGYPAVAHDNFMCSVCNFTIVILVRAGFFILVAEKKQQQNILENADDFSCLKTMH